MCVTLQQWMVVANARYGIVQGGAIAVEGGFLDATIAGLPAGAVLNAIGVSMGITGTAVVDRSHQLGRQRRCITVF